MAANLTPGQQIRVADVHNRTLESRRRRQPDAEWMDGGVLNQKTIESNRELYGPQSKRPAENRLAYPNIPATHRREFGTGPDDEGLDRRRKYRADLAERVAGIDRSDSRVDSDIPYHSYLGWDRDPKDKTSFRKLQEVLEAPHVRETQSWNIVFDLERVRLLGVAEKISAANPEMVRGLTPVEFVELCQDVDRAELLIKEKEVRRASYGEVIEKMEIIEGRPHPSAYAIDSWINEAFNRAIDSISEPSRFTKGEFLDYLGSLKLDWQAMDDKDIADGWREEAEYFGIDIDAAVTLLRLVEDPDITPREKLKRTKQALVNLQHNIAQEIEDQKKKTYVLEQQSATS